MSLAPSCAKKNLHVRYTPFTNSKELDSNKQVNSADKDMEPAADVKGNSSSNGNDTQVPVTADTNLQHLLQQNEEAGNGQTLEENGHDINMSDPYGHEMQLFDRAGGDMQTGEDDPAPSVMSRKTNRGNGSVFPDPNLNEMGLDLGSVIPESIPDVNIYQHKKTVAQGMMDLALFSANANQLRYVVESSNHPYFYPGVALITFSLIFQVAVGVGLLMNTRYNVKDKKEICIANKINNFTIVGIFLVTVVNVFISAFGVASNGPAVAILPRSGDEE